jgi:ribonuclease E
MQNKMLIDASHPEETRVVVLRGNRVEEFDFESASRKQLRGNIYLAKVTRVEPSLQAAFVDFGGNRHGFLAFSEIHPDYYQIPVADREALLADEARNARHDEEEEESGRARQSRRPRRREEAAAASSASGESVSEDATEEETAQTDETGSDAAQRDAHEAADANDDNAEHHDDENGDAESGGSESAQEAIGDRSRSRGGNAGAGDDEDHVESLGGGDALEEVSERPHRVRRHHYKIQEVIKRRQVLLVQVVKEERGTKGAALTTYLSLAGRYSVLMPNTARGGGISRKITDAADRKRLKSVAQELEVPEGMGVILRTAGASRTKAEVKRDFEYLLRVWETVRELTLQSSAPSLVYEEGSLIKRSIRDLYSKDIEEIHVAGEEGHREAKDFMRMLMPSHAKAVKIYRDPQPLFARFAVESQLDAMFNNVVTMKSGGYIVINQTEALVSIDVNSGRSTREHNIEDTALKTNLEASEEVARQLRLRDLAGLVVIDYIDMEENRNNKAVERKLKDCLKNDRARIQVGRISHFGLMEMSRQRIRTGVLESSTSPCPHCTGTGFMRSTPSLALHLVRAIEDTLLRNASYNIIIKTRLEVALYVLNQKRFHLRDLEDRFGVVITILGEEHIPSGQAFLMERGEPATGPVTPRMTAPASANQNAEDEADEAYEEESEAEEEAEDDAVGESPSSPRDGARADEADDQGARRKKRRRRRRGGRNGEREESSVSARTHDDSANGVARDADEDASDDDEDDDDKADGAEAVPGESAAETERKRRRRGRRGGRRNRRDRPVEATDGSSADEANDEEAASQTNDDSAEITDIPPVPAVTQPEADHSAPVEADAPKKRVRAPRKKKVEAAASADEPVAAEAVPDVSPKVRSIPIRAAAPIVVADMVAVPAAVESPAPEPEIVVPLVEVSDPNKPTRSGWWAKAKKALGGE